MNRVARLFSVAALSAFTGTCAYIAHGWWSFGLIVSGELLPVFGLALVISLVASVVLVPSLLVVGRVSPEGIRAGTLVATALLVAMLVATWHLTWIKRYPLDPSYLVWRAWNVYLYYAVFGLVYGVAWARLMPHRISRVLSERVSGA